MTTTGSRSDRAEAISSTAMTVAPAASARVPAAWITGPSASGSENGTPSSTRSAPPSAYASPIARDVARSGNPPIRYGIRAARLPDPANAAAIRSTPALRDAPTALIASAPAGSHRRRRSSDDAPSRPREHLGEVLVAATGAADDVEPRLGLGQQRVVQRVGGLQSRDDPLEPRHAAERRKRVLVAHRHVPRAARVAQPRVLRPGAGVVQPGRDRVRLADLALVVLKDRRERPVQHARPPAGRQRRAVAPRLEPLARRLDADELDVGVVDEAGEHADRVRPAAHARENPVREPVAALEQLRARLVADDALQVADDRRVRRRAHRRADDVVRVGDVRHPVADRLGHRLLERPRSRLHGDDARPEQLHPLHVGLLAADVLGPHVDDALDTEERAHGRRRDAVLARAGLGDDPRLAHPPGEQRLAERVVELVRARVHEVLALEPDLAAGRLAQPLGQVQGRGPAAEVAAQHRELLGVRRVAPGGEPRRLELRERRHERLGDVLAAVRAEAVLEAPDRHHAASSTGAGAVDATAAANARSFSRSFTPARASVPLAVSTAYGCVASIAAATFSGESPPLSTNGTSVRRCRTSSQSKVSPVPPQRPAWWASRRCRSVWNRWSAATSAPVRTRAAFMTFAPVRRATSAQYAGPSSPWSWTIVRPTPSATAATSSSGALTNTPQISAWRRSVRAIRSASGISQRRGEPAKRITPSDQAPASTARFASSRLVMPQNLMRGGGAAVTPPSYGLSGAVRLRRGLRRERHLHRPARARADDLDLHHVALALAGDRIGEVVGRRDLPPVDPGDDVAAQADRVAVELGDDVAAPDAGLRGGAAGRHGLHERAVADGQVEVGQRAVDPERRHAEEATVDTAVLLELGQEPPRRVDRDREADAHVAGAAAAGLDLGVDADHAAGRVEQRAAGVTGVDRRVGLDDAVDLEAVRRLDRALRGRHDARRERPLEPEGVADRDRRVADLDAGRRAERQRRQLAGPRRDAQHREVARFVAAQDPGVDDALVRELDLDLRGSRHDMRVRDDRAVAVDGEARARRLPALLLREAEFERRRRLLDDLGADEHDAGRGALVDVAGRQAAPVTARRRLPAQRRLLDDRGRARTADVQHGDDADGGGAPHHRRHRGHRNQSPPRHDAKCAKRA